MFMSQTTNDYFLDHSPLFHFVPVPGLQALPRHRRPLLLPLLPLLLPLHLLPLSCPLPFLLPLPLPLPLLSVFRSARQRNCVSEGKPAITNIVVNRMLAGVSSF